MPSYEKFHRNKKGQGESRKRQPSKREMVRRARQRIIGAMHKRGNGFIYASSQKDAVRTLRKWVRNKDGEIGRHHQVLAILNKAFRELYEAGVLVQHRTGYWLRPHTVVHP